MGRLHESGLVDAELLDVASKVWKRCLPHAYDSDILALDEGDLGTSRKEAGNARRRHPPGGSPTEHDDTDRLALLAHPRTLA